MANWRRLSGRLIAASALISAGIYGGYREWIDAQPTEVQNQTVGDLEELCTLQPDSDACHIIATIEPRADLPAAQCLRAPDGRLCRRGLLYGPGEGGANACPDTTGWERYPCTTRHRSIPERTRAALQAGEHAGLIDLVERRALEQEEIDNRPEEP